MAPESSQGVDRAVREVWKTLSVLTGTPGWAWEPSGGRGMDDLAARLAHLNTLMQNIQARQVAGVELNASSGVERPGRGLRPM